MRTLKILTLVEAASFLILLLVAMPLKYFAGLPAAVQWTGWIHGILFILFSMALAAALFSSKIDFQRSVIVFTAALIPFAPFFLEWKKDHP